MNDNTPITRNSSEIMPAVVQEIISWIDANLSKNINSSVVAEKSGYTRWHFQRKFREIQGDSLLNYIRKKKAEKAIFDIVYTGLGFGEIAENNGFNSVSSLVRAVKRFYCVTPSQLRNGGGLDIFYGNESQMP